MSVLTAKQSGPPIEGLQMDGLLCIEFPVIVRGHFFMHKCIITSKLKYAQNIKLPGEVYC